ncbi:hypothetical protein L1987_21104 [Smallanthus sonchifolius]|uniref:Uncharacterized protein n=1 Tax=Smallanthus sonchifolius TaxID=185202 RepID=A0ACB9IV52_9ASTR|nr:hypothetical protein L1987_21104 [Smallanthus sonchifolius]
MFKYDATEVNTMLIQPYDTLRIKFTTENDYVVTAASWNEFTFHNEIAVQIVKFVIWCRSIPNRVCTAQTPIVTGAIQFNLPMLLGSSVDERGLQDKDLDSVTDCFAGKRCVKVSWLGSGATRIGVQAFVSLGDSCAKETHERLSTVVARGDGTVGWVLGFHLLHLYLLVQETTYPGVLVRSRFGHPLFFEAIWRRMDAQVAYGFHHLRNEKPYFAQAPISNKIIYSGYSCKQGWFFTSCIADPGLRQHTRKVF